MVEITAGAAAVDQSSTAVGANLDDELFHNIPVQRGVTGLFYLAPGTTDSLGGGTANPSSFIADFFNVTNNRRVRLPNQFRESTAGQLNPDFLQPQLFHLPFNMRLGARLTW